MRWLSMVAWMWAGCVAGVGGADPAAPQDADPHGGEEEDHEAVVQLTEAAVAAGRIRVAPVSVGRLEASISVPARIVLDPQREALVSAWIEGQVEAIAVRSGETVRADQVLARVLSPELGEAVAAYRSAHARHEAAEARRERMRLLKDDGVSSEAQLLEAHAVHAEADAALEAAEERLRILGVPMDVGAPHDGEHFPSRVPVTSPIAGTVLEAEASVGRRVEPGEALFRIGDLDEVWLVLAVYERDLATVRAGQTVRFSVPAWPDRGFEGEVDRVGDWVDPSTRTVDVRVVVDNPDHALKPNMFATASLSVPQQDDVVGPILPSTAVQQVEGREVVFVEEGAHRFAVRPVVVARRTNDHVLVRAGLEAGEPVVLEGAFTLKSELEKGALGGGHAH